MAARRPPITEQSIDLLERRIADLERAATVAEEAGQHGPAIQARSRIATLEQQLVNARAAQVEARETDPVKLVRLKRLRASAEGSHVASARYTDMELKLRAAKAAEEEAKRAAGKAPVDYTGALGVLRSIVLTAPDSVIMEIETAIAERRGEIPADVDEEEDLDEDSDEGGQ